MSLDARSVDPRDVSIEELEPTYRVYFWYEDGHPCREFDLMGVDAVDGAIEWCDDHVEAGETYILGILRAEPVHTPGAESESGVFIRLKGYPPPGHSVGERVG